MYRYIKIEKKRSWFCQVCFYIDWTRDFNFIVTSRARCFFVSYHTRTHCLLREMHFLFLSDGSDKFEICCSITFVFVTFLCFYIGFTYFGGSAGLNVKSNLSFDYIRPCCLTDNEFNLELVHFNNSTALIAGLKGFALFWQQKVFIKFTCLFTCSEWGACLLGPPRQKLALWYCEKLSESGSIYLSIFLKPQQWLSFIFVLKFKQAVWCQNRYMISLTEIQSCNL